MAILSAWISGRSWLYIVLSGLTLFYGFHLLRWFNNPDDKHLKAKELALRRVLNDWLDAIQNGPWFGKDAPVPTFRRARGVTVLDRWRADFRQVVESKQATLRFEDEHGQPIEIVRNAVSTRWDGRGSAKLTVLPKQWVRGCLKGQRVDELYEKVKRGGHGPRPYLCEGRVCWLVPSFAQEDGSPVLEQLHKLFYKRSTPRSAYRD